MKDAFMRFRAVVVGVTLMCVVVSGAYAATSTNAAGAATEYLDPNGDYSRLTEPEALKMAYQVLADANHDYNGHRKGAMIEIGAAFSTAIELMLHLDHDLGEIVFLSLTISLVGTATAALCGLPLGAAAALYRFPGRGVALVVLNAMMGLPPVVVGLAIYLALSRSGPLGAWGLRR